MRNKQEEAGKVIGTLMLGLGILMGTVIMFALIAYSGDVLATLFGLFIVAILIRGFLVDMIAEGVHQAKRK